MTTISIGTTMPTATSTASNGGNLDHDMNDRQCRGVNVGHGQRTSVLPPPRTHVDITTTKMSETVTTPTTTDTSTNPDAFTMTAS